MIKRGFSKEYAGAVEATASSGGQIMPPVMGVAAFMMAGIIGIPYAHIALAAALPAVLYYVFLGVSIELQAIKRYIQRGRCLDRDKKRLQKNMLIWYYLLSFLSIPFP